MAKRPALLLFRRDRPTHILRSSPGATVVLHCTIMRLAGQSTLLHWIVDYSASQHAGRCWEEHHPWEDLRPCEVRTAPRHATGLPLVAYRPRLSPSICRCGFSHRSCLIRWPQSADAFNRASRKDLVGIRAIYRMFVSLGQTPRIGVRDNIG